MTDIDKSKNIKEVELPAELSLKLDSIIPDPKKREQLKKFFLFLSPDHTRVHYLHQKCLSSLKKFCPDWQNVW